MTELEKIGMEKLEQLLFSILDRAKDDNKDRFQHERIYVKSEASRAIDVCRAIYPIEGRK